MECRVCSNDNIRCCCDVLMENIHSLYPVICKLIFKKTNFSHFSRFQIPSPLGYLPHLLWAALYVAAKLSQRFVSSPYGEFFLSRSPISDSQILEAHPLLLLLYFLVQALCLCS